jgi:hypothetical protein
MLKKKKMDRKRRYLSILLESKKKQEATDAEKALAQK